ncbi:MAG: iron-sulfur cluster assembly scaffold protein, partial [Nanoarchaeota archaeon]
GKDDKMNADVRDKDENWFYSQTVKEHFFHPRNIFKTEQEAQEYEKTADGIGLVGSPQCGDMMKMWIKIKDGKVAECKWQTFGCVSAISSTSILSEMAIGKTLEEAKKITPQDIVKALGGLPARKIHCSVLGDQALKAAIKDYQEKKK